MPIPKEILNVPRPVNTVVTVYGKNKDKYGVRKRIGCKRTNGRNVPVTGPTIGHIIDGAYIPVGGQEELSRSAPDLKDWAVVRLADREFRPVLDELSEFYNHKDSMKIYCISLLRVCYPGICDSALREAYEQSFLSEYYPGVALSKNTVGTFLHDLGKACSRIGGFMRRRAEEIAGDHHVLVDGTLKSDESGVNSLSNFSRKARVKGTRDISVLYAFDLEAMEPVCSKCYPGNMLDLTAYPDFVESNGISSGIIVGDKGFPSKAIDEFLSEHPGLHYLNPVKRNSKFIATHNLYNFSGVLQGHAGITFKREKCTGASKWLYAFRDSEKAAAEEKAWLKNAMENGTFDDGEFKRKQRSFGTIVLESDLELEPEVIYKAYSHRWEIEIVMRFYKDVLGLDETRVHDDYSVIGSEFCNFLASVLTFRLIRAFDSADLLKKRTYKELTDILRRAKKLRDGSSGDWRLIKMNPSQLEVLQSLDLLPRPEEAPKRNPGRPRKNGI